MPNASLAPGFLIASPPMGDPNFERSVVLLALHGPRGALGFVVNRLVPLGLGEVLGMAGYGPRVEAVSGPVHSGGPVEPGSGWIVAGEPSHVEGIESTIELSESVRVSSSRVAFDLAARDVEPPHGAGLGRRLVLLGYSGWGPGQLEGEIAQGAWIPAPFDESILFDVPVGERWEAVYARLGIAPAMGLGMRTVGEA